MSHALGGKTLSSHFCGDGNPRLFDFNSPIGQKELMDLYITTNALEKGVKWIPAQILSAGWIFKEEVPFIAEKFGKPFVFDSFTDWFKHCGAYQEALYAMAWANLFHNAKVMHYMADDEPEIYKGKPYYGEIEPGVDICTKVEAMYSFYDKNGWQIAKVDDDDEPEIYKVTKTNLEDTYIDCDHKQEAKIHYVHASRVVSFNAPKKSMGYDGTARAQTIAHLCKLQKQLLQSVYVAAKNLIAGYVLYRAKNADAAAATNKTLESFSHLSRIGWDGSEDLEDVLKVVVPDFNADQITKLNLMIQKSLATSMNISIRNLGEEDIASGLGEGGAGISHEITLFEVKEMQRFYQRPIEHMFYLMGKINSTFVWNEPMIKDETIKEDQKEKELEKNTGEEDDGTDKDKETDKEE